MSDVAATPVSRREPTGSEFIAMRDSAEFGELRRTYRSFTFPMTVAFFVWYVVYVLAAVFAPDFMAIELGGGWNVGLVFGLAQFLTTFIIAVPKPAPATTANWPASSRRTKADCPYR